MTDKYSNMVTQRYCKVCGSFEIERVHRGFLKKVILKKPALFKCKNCEEALFRNDFRENEVRKVPMFIGIR
jgi:hypothetical protein